MVVSEGNGEEESGSSSEMHIDLGKKDADTKGVKRKREDNGGEEEGNKKKKT